MCKSERKHRTERKYRDVGKSRNIHITQCTVTRWRRTVKKAQFCGKRTHKEEKRIA